MMTSETIRSCGKAFALLVVGVGGVGSLSCVPFAFNNNIVLIATAGLYFVAGAVMITGGMLSYVLLSKEA
ncbi:MAG: hypothetical protein NUV91_07015 [Candidatus Omnitrophica bacterium]|nr:hypothetical protein [Candidatus Omnitrophota bacterium]